MECSAVAKFALIREETEETAEVDSVLMVLDPVVHSPLFLCIVERVDAVGWMFGEMDLRTCDWCLFSADVITEVTYSRT
jgi:hypothetical protein